MLGSTAERRAVGKAYGLFAGAFALLVLVVAVVAQLGLGERIVAFLVIGFTFVTYAVIGVATRTLSLPEFQAAGRSIPAGFNGMATAAALIPIGGLGALAAGFFASPGAALSVAVGWVVGLVLLATLIAPYYRKSGAVTLPDFLAVRFGNPLVRLTGVAILILGSFALLPAALAVAGTIAAHFLGLQPRTALMLMTGVLVLSSLFGGMRSVTFVAGAQMILFLIAILAPAILFSAKEFALPVPQITYGAAVDALTRAADPGVAVLPGAFLPLGGSGGLDLLAIMLSLAAGIACLPHVLARSGTTPGIAAARRSVAWTLAVVAAVVVTIPALAAFTKWSLVEQTVGVEATELPEWLFALGGLDMVRVCGAAVASVAELGSACGASKIINGLEARDIALSGDAILFGFADITGLPYVMTALIGAGALAAAMAVAGAMLMAVTTTLSHDIYGRLLSRRAPAGRRLILGRLILIAVVAIAFGLALTRRDDVVALAPLAPALAASGFFPTLVLGIWWNRTTWAGALAGMIAGFAAAVAAIVLAPSGATVAAAGAAIFGLPVGFAVTFVVSLLGRAPSESRLEVIAAIRRPSHDPILEDHAA